MTRLKNNTKRLIIKCTQSYGPDLGWISSRTTEAEIIMNFS